MRFAIIFLFFPLFSVAQNNDSLRWANDSLDRSIFEMVADWERNQVDYIFMRTYDSTGYFENRFRFLYRPDSCTFIHEMHVWEDYSIHDVHIGRIEAIRNPNRCFDEISIVEKRLSEFENYFQSTPIPLPDFHLSSYTIYGHINGKFILQRFESDFIESFHSGMLYDTVCHQLGCRCSN